MLTKNQIKHISSLSVKKYREINREFIAEGVKVVSELIKSRYTVKKIFCTGEWSQNNDAYFSSGKFDMEVISLKELERISLLTTPNQVLAIAEIPEKSIAKINTAKELVLALDEIKDPGNLGTIIRTADWFGIKKIICSENTVDIYNPKVIQSTMGSLFRVEIAYMDLVEFLNNQKPAKIYGALLDGESIYNKELADNGIIVIGNESNGISEKIIPLITDKLFIPRSASGNQFNFPESLNASVATALICYEFSRQNFNK
jgi:TrmH family RNA methyltransferase